MTRYQEGVGRLLDSYLALPEGARVRLAKRTSNLFRARTATQAPGLDVSGLTGVISIDPAARTADVAGMCTYEDLVAATPGALPRSVGLGEQPSPRHHRPARHCHGCTAHL